MFDNLSLITSLQFGVETFENERFFLNSICDLMFNSVNIDGLVGTSILTSSLHLFFYK